MSYPNISANYLKSLSYRNSFLFFFLKELNQNVCYNKLTLVSLNLKLKLKELRNHIGKLFLCPPQK